MKLTDVFIERRIITKKINRFWMGVKSTIKIKIQESDQLPNEVLTASDEEDEINDINILLITDRARNNDGGGIG